MIKYALALSILMTIAGCIEQAPPQKGSQAFVQNIYRQIIKHDNYPIKFYIHYEATEQQISNIFEVMNLIELKANKKLFQYQGITSNPDRLNVRDGMNVIYIKNTWEDDRTSEQGRTSVYWAGNEIEELDIRINSKNFTFSYNDDDLNSSTTDFKSLMLHELLHSLGLKHCDFPNSIMNPYLPVGEVRMELSLNELDALKLL